MFFSLVLSQVKFNGIISDPGPPSFTLRSCCSHSLLVEDKDREAKSRGMDKAPNTRHAVIYFTLN
jgi:hypothetical protein